MLSLRVGIALLLGVGYSVVSLIFLCSVCGKISVFSVWLILSISVWSPMSWDLLLRGRLMPTLRPICPTTGESILFDFVEQLVDGIEEVEWVGLSSLFLLLMLWVPLIVEILSLGLWFGVRDVADGMAKFLSWIWGMFFAGKNWEKPLMFRPHTAYRGIWETPCLCSVNWSGSYWWENNVENHFLDAGRNLWGECE